ncbi:aminotransferase class IV [uncultured Phascolarctobacterium sp.]|uniref:aminotransferase class IV n=1 Tax=uncultured Phascolarctobacterium sp. TaxID=512296 RepID=UPI0026128F3E|nr:aminotransferase class IV [uncultured Phascolarctobacterium sp.]
MSEIKENLVLIDGEIMPMEEAFVDVNDRGHNFGDGVFELVPVYNGRCFALLPLMNNLFDSVISVKIPGVYMIEELVEFHESLIEATGMQDCEIYTQITRGSAPYGLAYPEPSVPRLTMFAVPVDRAALAEKRAKGVNVITEKDERWSRCDVNTLNRLPEVVAKQKATVSRAFDALFVRDGKITESTEASFFVYKDGVLWTHPENNFIHKNVVRRLLMERLAKDLDLQIIERPFDKEFALKADEAFLCGPRCEFMPVTKIDRGFVNGGKLGELTAKLQKAYTEFVVKECPAK